MKKSPIILGYMDSAAGTMRNAGSGKSWLIGTFVGHSGTACGNEDTRKFLIKLLDPCGIGPQHNGRLLLRKLIGEQKIMDIH